MKVTLGTEGSAGVPMVGPPASSPLTSGARIDWRHPIWFGLASWLAFGWTLIELPLEPPGVIVVVASEISYQEESEVQVEGETNVFCRVQGAGP
ncbi:hypothetical protein, partial [Pararobbsia alpina]|uniref:hypothetical protein n=1 Tax=Pararobbsia alpina TaxID=621374 RepID=UPI001C2EDE19